MVETRSHRGQELERGQVEDQVTPSSSRDVSVVIPTSSSTNRTPTMNGQSAIVASHSSILLGEFVPTLKKIISNRDEQNYIDAILSPFLRLCSGIGEKPTVSGDGDVPTRAASSEATDVELREKIDQLRTLVNRRRHFDAATMQVQGEVTSEAPERSDSTLGNENNPDDTLAMLNKPLLKPATPPVIGANQNAAKYLISNAQVKEILVKLSDGEVITGLRRYSVESLTAILNGLLGRSSDIAVSNLQLQRAVLTKTGDLSLLMQSKEDRDALRASPGFLEDVLASARILTPSYKVLMKGIEPFSVNLVTREDEVSFVTQLQEDNPMLTISDIDFVDFEPREDLSRTTTIVMEFAELDHANKAVENGLVWGGKPRQVEHYNLSCNLKFPELYAKYCEQIRARRVEERRRREEEDEMDSRLRYSKIFSPLTSMAINAKELFLSSVKKPERAHESEAGVAKSSKRGRPDDPEAGSNSNGRKRSKRAGAEDEIDATPTPATKLPPQNQPEDVATDDNDDSSDEDEDDNSESAKGDAVQGVVETKESDSDSSESDDREAHNTVKKPKSGGDKSNSKSGDRKNKRTVPPNATPGRDNGDNKSGIGDKKRVLLVAPEAKRGIDILNAEYTSSSGPDSD